MANTKDAIREAIDSITDSVRFNCADGGLVDFLINYLAANIDDIEELYNRDEDEEEYQD